MSQAQSPSTEYTVAFVGFAPADQLVEAEVSSPLLDAELHPEGTARVQITTETVELKPKPRFSLSSFLLESLRNLFGDRR
ncbi:MAG TPA: hypothetical protein VF669_03965 [Tepidisphaeraceae bacterium]|jgi:hypothetical protein